MKAGIPATMTKHADGKVPTTPGQIIVIGDPKEWNRQSDELRAAGGFWVVSPLMELVQVEQLLAIDPAELGGPDRFSFCYPTQGKNGETIVNWESVPTLVTLDDDGKPVVQLGEQTLRVELRVQRDAKDDSSPDDVLAQLVRERERRQLAMQHREQVRHEMGLMSVPTETSQILSGSIARAGSERAAKALVRNHKVEVTAGVYRPGQGKPVESRMVTVELDRETIGEALGETTRRGSKRRAKTSAIQFPLEGMDRTTGPEEDLAGLALATVQLFDTDCMLTLLTGIHISLCGDGVFPAAASVIGRARGMMGKDGKLQTSRRHAIERQLDALRRVRLLVTPYGKSREEADRIPLLTWQGETKGIRGKGRVPLLALQAQVAHRMRSGRCLLMDRRILAADPRKDDWPLRIYWQVCTQLNLNWVSQGLHQQGGKMQMNLLDLLGRAGLDWRSVRDQRGPKALAVRVRQAFRDLQAWRDGDPLLHAELDLGDDPSLKRAVVVVRPPDAMAHQMTHSRSKAIDHREQMLLRAKGGTETAPKGRRRKA